LLLLPTIALAGYLLIGFTAVFSPGTIPGPRDECAVMVQTHVRAGDGGVFGVIVADVRGANINLNYVIFPLLALMVISIVNLLIHTNRNKSGRRCRQTRIQI